MNKNIEYYQNLRPELLVCLPKQYARVLEIGCGEGAFRSNLNASCEYWGVEPCPEAAKAASGRLNHVLVGTFENVSNQLPHRFFDLVICNDVIEHMLDHDWFFEKISTIMTTNGTLMGSVPNLLYWDNLYELLWRREWQYVDIGIRDRTHLRWFTRKSLLRTFREHGFHVKSFSVVTPHKLYKPNTVKRVLLYPLLALLVAGSLGFYRDVLYPQLIFCIQPELPK